MKLNPPSAPANVALRCIETSAEVQSSVTPAPGRVTEEEQYLSNKRTERTEHDPYEMPKDFTGMNAEAAGMRKEIIRTRLKRFQEELRAQLCSVFLIDQDGNLKCEGFYGFDSSGNQLQSDLLKNEECSLDDVKSILVKAVSPTGKRLSGGEKNIYGRPIVINSRDHIVSNIFNIAGNQLNEIMRKCGETYSACFMPINGSNRSYGVIRIINKVDDDNRVSLYGKFTEGDTYLMSLFAANLASDLKRAKSADQVKLILFLQHFALHSCKRPKRLDQNIETYHEIFNFVVKYLTSTDFSCVKSAHLRVHRNGELDEIASWTNREKGKKDKSARSVDEHPDSIVAKVYKDCRDLILYNYTQHKYFKRSINKAWITENKFRDFLCVALKVNEDCLGTISYFTGQHQILAKEDYRFLRTISNLLAILLASGVRQEETSNSSEFTNYGPTASVLPPSSAREQTTNSTLLLDDASPVSSLSFAQDLQSVSASNQSNPTTISGKSGQGLGNIFVSHGIYDKDPAREISNYLADSLRGTSTNLEELNIVTSLSTSKPIHWDSFQTFIILLSDSCYTDNQLRMSEWVNINSAIWSDPHKKLIPIRLSGSYVPAFLNKFTVLHGFSSDSQKQSTSLSLLLDYPSTAIIEQTNPMDKNYKSEMEQRYRELIEAIV